MAKNSCIMYPEVNGEPSRLYKDLLKRKKLRRPVANLIYATYITNGTADAMDQVLDANGNPVYKRNEQGQHNMKDVLKFLDYDSWQINLTDAEIQLGAVDPNTLQRIDYTDSKEAMEKAHNFNQTHPGYVAYVNAHSRQGQPDIYNIMVTEKNDDTHTLDSTIDKKLQIWDMAKQFFAAKNIDIENMPPELANIFSAYNAGGIAQALKNVKRLGIGNMYKKDALLLFNMDINSPHVQRLINSFGSLEAAAQALDDINHGIGNYTNGQKTLIGRAITNCQRMQGLDLDAIQQQMDQMALNLALNNPEEAIKDTLHKLNKKYKIGIDEIHKINNEINTLSDAATEAVFNLQRQIRKLEREKGHIQEGKNLENILNQLMRELSYKKYYSGIMNFLNVASTQVSDFDNMMQNIPQTGTDLENLFNKAKTYHQITSTIDQYYPIIAALADDSLIIDESINQVDVDNIKQEAKRLKEYLDKKKAVIKTLSQGVMEGLMINIVGNETPDGQTMVNAIKMAQVDSSGFDKWLYSLGRASNPLLGAMGSVLQTAQRSRDGLMNEYDSRIKRATNRLQKSGSDSSFMYEDDGHIISDIDWELYKAARKATISSLIKQGLSGYDFKDAIEQWEEANTEDRVVDAINGRIERVPNYQYRKNNGLVWNDQTNRMEFRNTSYTPAQQEYYHDMMQLKGEIGTLFPNYAQHHYLPPQIRRNMFDALGQAKNGKDVLKAVKNKLQNFYKIREDDTNYATNGIIDGDEYVLMPGAFDNTPLKEIPIFYVKEVEQGELLKEFSTGLQALANTAINYDALHNVADVVEFMGDYILSRDARSAENQAEMVNSKYQKAVKDLNKWGKNNNTAAMIEGFLDRELYGIKRDPEENRLLGKIIDNIVGYTSFKGLSTNIKGMFNNYVVGEWQMMVEAGCGEFYGINNYLRAHAFLFGKAGAYGEIMDTLAETKVTKASLLKELFDPHQENFSSKGHTRYHKSIVRKILAHDLSFIGYGAGEFLIHDVNMFAILNNQKVKCNGKTISLLDAFEAVNKKDGVAELQLKPGTTKLNGEVIDNDFIEKVKGRIRYCNQTCHGSMNDEDKGLIYQHWYGRLAANFKQWMVEHYSRRFRKRHFDASLGENREGYWTSTYHFIKSDQTADAFEDKKYAEAIGMFMRDCFTIVFRASTQWENLDEMQRYNVKRTMSEFTMLMLLAGLSFTLGEPDKHKKEFWRRWWIYQVKRTMIEAESGIPIHPKAIGSALTIFQSPMAGINTANSLLYTVYGVYNGDLTRQYKSGPHKGDNVYIRNMMKYNLPFFKDFEQMQKLDTDDTIFQVFKDTPTNR